MDDQFEGDAESDVDDVLNRRVATDDHPVNNSVSLFLKENEKRLYTLF